MSGRDECKISDIPDCPNCKRKPKHWTLGHMNNKPLCWVYSKGYVFGASRYLDGLTVDERFIKNNESFDLIKHKIEYAWCPKCHSLIKGREFLTLLVLISKQLRKIVRSNI